MKIERGIITNDHGVVIGSANHDLKYGYHPAVLVEVRDKRKWFEYDEPDLVAKIADFAREAFTS
jgi:hypothetical protein